MPNPTEIAVFGGGCFWCIEAIFEQLKGVVKVASGYAGGHSPSPTYESVSSGETGHAEVLRIEYDPSVITYKDLLTVFFAAHDPTTLNRQGNDVGTQYRSAVFYTTEQQMLDAEDFIEMLDEGGPLEKRVVTTLQPLEKFFEAEAYHHHYFQTHPEKAYCQLVINPKYQKLKEKFSQLMKP